MGVEFILAWIFLFPESYWNKRSVEKNLETDLRNISYILSTESIFVGFEFTISQVSQNRVSWVFLDYKKDPLIFKRAENREENSNQPFRKDQAIGVLSEPWRLF